MAAALLTALAMPCHGQDHVKAVLVRPDAALGSAMSAGGPSFLQQILDRLRGSPVCDAPGCITRVELAPGTYHLQATSFIDSTCGNCDNPSTPVQASFGIRLDGDRLELVGSSPDSVIIVTNAGYGVFVNGCQQCSITGVTITGGIRDVDGRATDAAIVVKQSSVVIDSTVIRDNIGDSAIVASTVVGIAGIAGREASEIHVRRSQILRNSWDGIALYRDASAQIEDNVVDGVDKARGALVGGGRGVGIGLTWNARAEVQRNLVRRYWKGIGVFVDATAIIDHNVVEDILTWGISYWGAADGAPQADITNNVVYRTGACGIAIDAQPGRSQPGTARGSLDGNVIVGTGLDARYDSGEPYCHQRPIARHSVPLEFAIGSNLMHGNRQPTNAWPQEVETTESSIRRALIRFATETPGSVAVHRSFAFQELLPERQP